MKIITDYDRGYWIAVQNASASFERALAQAAEPISELEMELKNLSE